MKRLILSLLHGFPRTIKKVYFYYEMRRESPKYCVERLKGNSCDIGDLLPMLEKNGKVAYYQIISSYYEHGNSCSDWAMGDDGKYRDLRLHHIEKVEKE